MCPGNATGTYCDAVRGTLIDIGMEEVGLQLGTYVKQTFGHGAKSLHTVLEFQKKMSSKAKILHLVHVIQNKCLHVLIHIFHYRSSI